VATQLARDRCRERIERLSRSSLDGESIQREAIADLQRVIGFDRWCLPLADPDTLLPGLGIGDMTMGRACHEPSSWSTPAPTSPPSTMWHVGRGR
jgi:GAF domain-containing protein